MSYIEVSCFSLCHDILLLCMHYVFMLLAHACDDGATTWHHQENTIKGGSSFLFTIGNADFELNTSVIASYLTDRSQKVKIGSSESSSVTLECGVPQGLVLGPILFILYTTPVGQICRKHSIHYHLYADDSQLYMSFKPSKPGSKEACLYQLEGCISDIRLWIANNMLKLNDEKTKFIIFGTCQQLAKILDISIKVGLMKIQPVDEVRNLGFFMDRFLKNSAHINKL